MTAITQDGPAALTVVVRGRPGPTWPGRGVPPVDAVPAPRPGHRVALGPARGTTPRPVGAPGAAASDGRRPREIRPTTAPPLPRPAAGGWGYPPPSSYPRIPVPLWAAHGPTGLTGPSGPLADPIFVTGPTALDDLLRRWLP